jgi:hypothetical protein
MWGLLSFVMPCTPGCLATSMEPDVLPLQWEFTLETGNGKPAAGNRFRPTAQIVA